MANGNLKNKHLAELHELAEERGVKGFRMLTRDELLSELGDGDGGGGDGGGSRSGGGRSRGGRGPRGRGRDEGRKGRGRDDSQEEEEEDPGEPVSGVLEITSRGHGFVRLEGLNEGEDDIYVSPSQIRRCELEAGDLIAGPARKPRRGERHPALVHIDTVNGVAPGERATKFEELDAVPASRRLPLTGESASEDARVLLRAIDLLTPLAHGHRVLVNSTRGSGRTMLLRALGAELAKVDDLIVVIVLVDERPEEETAWREALPEDVHMAIAGADMRPGEQLRVVELAVARAKRKAEAGADVALLVDSLSRLAVAADDPGAAKPIFAAGRETASDEAGSLTVIATALTGDDDGGVAKVLATTENVTLVLDPDLAAAGVYPALDVNACRVTGEDSLRSDAEQAGIKALREELAGLSPREAAEKLAERLGSESSNEALLAGLAK